MRTCKIYLVFLVLFVTNVSFNQKLPKDITPNSKRRFVANKDSHTTLYILFDQSKLEKKVKIESDLIYYYFKTGNIHSSKGNYNGHLLNGKYLKEYRSRKPWESGCFDLGVKNGKWLRYFENGQIQREENWEKGLKQGAFIEYDSLGNLLHQQNFKDNELHGIQINTISGDTTEFIHGQKEGVWKIKDANGQLVGYETLKKGKRFGLKVDLNGNDTLSSSEYKNDLLDGWNIDYNSGDSTHFNNGLKHGLEIVHNGSLTDYLNYKSGKLNGTSYYLENQDTLISSEYKDGLLDGETVDYKKQITTYYSKGKEVDPPQEKEVKEKEPKATKPKKQKKNKKEQKE